MCNPPFYTSIDSLLSSAALKSLPPSSACTGTTTEMVYVPNGEAGFAKRMLQESLSLRERVGWYTTLFGKLSSVVEFIAEIKQQIPQNNNSNSTVSGGNWAVAEFVQGTTKRWAVAWSYRDRRPSMKISVCRAPALKGCSPFPPELVFVVERETEWIVAEVQALLDTLPIENQKRSVHSSEFYGEVFGNVWSRTARRALARGDENIGANSGAGGNEVKMGFLITISDGRSVSVRWKRGRDVVLFESFCGTVKRKLLTQN
jgi:23S rRNA (adenine1618-N6)-methyltransferase